MTESTANEPSQRDARLQMDPPPSSPTSGDGDPKVNRTDPNEVLRKPIPGPEAVNPWFLEPDYERPLSAMGQAGRFMADLVRKPAHWIRENVVLANKGPKYYYYHRKYPRVLPIDECYMDDFACIYEANLEYQRTHRVDRATLELLRSRRDACHVWYTSLNGRWYTAEQCAEIADTFKREELNYYMKYGDLPAKANVQHAYNKQKCRMIVDRRIALKRQQEEAQMEREAQN